MMRCLPLLGLLIATPVQAGDASPWAREPQSAMRLVAGASLPGPPAVRHAGVEIDLKPGWKTYWRYPGDAGVPPRFDWTGSVNVAEVRVGWPAPHGFETEGMVSIGYKGRVLFPLAVVPKDPAQPVTLTLSLDYAVCETLCVPAFGKAVLALAVAGGAHDPAIRQAVATVPAPAPHAAASVAAVRIDRTQTPPLVTVELAVAEPTGRVEAFVEGPAADWALPVPRVTRVSPTRAQASFALDGMPAGADGRGAALLLTIVTDRGAVEATIRPD
jgi:DsbC/DsbD-like thiol-disulfide interchange protein